jgi:hypothetical protein
VNEVSTDELKRAVEATHGGTATYVTSIVLREKFKGKMAWEGIVAIFNVADNPHATRAYAWAQDGPSGSPRYVTVLHVPPIMGPHDAVRAAIVAEQKAKRAK